MCTPSSPREPGTPINGIPLGKKLVIMTENALKDGNPERAPALGALPKDPTRMNMWKSLNPTNDKREAEAPASHEELRADDVLRMRLLEISRETSPVGTVMRLDLIRRTVIPKLLTQPVQWLVLLVYGITAVLTRTSVIITPEIDDRSFSGAGTMVTFMIIFYVRATPARPLRALM
jgi:hypothetical protein